VSHDVAEPGICHDRSSGRGTVLPTVCLFVNRITQKKVVDGFLVKFEE